MKQTESFFKKYSLVVFACISSAFFFSCNNNQNQSAGSGDSVSAITTLPAPTDTNAIAVNSDTSKMNADTAMHQKTMNTATSAGKTKKKGTVSTKMEGDNNAKMEMDKNGIYSHAEVMPMFPGGENALDNYLSNHIQYPETAMDDGTEGTVTVQFAVDEHGKVYQPTEVGNKVGDGLDEEALKVIAGMPQWTPGKVKGKSVKTYYTLPVVFTLQ